MNNEKCKYSIEQRRRQVADLLAESYLEREIAEKLGVNQVMVSRDIKALHEMSKRFIADLAKSSLGFYYQSCINGIDRVARKAWEMFNNFEDKYPNLSDRDKLLALKIIIDASQAKFSLYQEGPNIMALSALEKRVEHIEGRNSDTYFEVKQLS